MLNVMLPAMAFLADDVSFAGLGERKIVQLVNPSRWKGANKPVDNVLSLVADHRFYWSYH